jgi:hypothetical protein
MAKRRKGLHGVLSNHDSSFGAIITNRLMMDVHDARPESPRGASPTGRQHKESALSPHHENGPSTGRSVFGIANEFVAESPPADLQERTSGTDVVLPSKLDKCQ